MTTKKSSGASQDELRPEFDLSKLRLAKDPRFLARVEAARSSIARGEGVPLERLPKEGA